MDFFIKEALTQPVFYGSWVLVVVFSICCHEYAHAAAALRCGDDTAAARGHLTLNPLVQMGVASIILLLVIGIAWGAVPVNTANLRPRWRRAAVALAGPATNLLLAAVFGAGVAIVSVFFGGRDSLGVLFTFLATGAVANSVLFVFNMLPVPMFDGWSVYALAVPAMDRIPPAQAASWSWFLLAVMMFSRLFSWVWQAGEWLAVLLIGSVTAMLRLLGF